MYRFWSWRSISSFRRDLTCERFLFIIFFSPLIKHKPYVISRQKHLLYRVRIIIICITNHFCYHLSYLHFLRSLFIFLSILHIIVVLPSPPPPNLPHKTKTIRIHVFWTRWWSCVEKKVCNSVELRKLIRSRSVAYKFWLGMFFEVGCSADLHRMQFHSANCRVCSVRMRSVYDQSARFVIHPVSGIWHHR